MKNRAQMAQLKSLWETNYKDQGLSNRQVGKLLDVNHTVISRWKDARIQEEEVYTPQYSFQEISVILKLKPNQVKILYLDATRKIKIILERRGVDLGCIPETLEDLNGQF